MKKFLLPPIASLVLVLTCVSAFASPAEVSIRPVNQTGHQYSVMKFVLTITNNQNFPDSFQIIFSGPHLNWLIPGLIAKGVGAHSSEEMEVVFYPTGPSNGNNAFSVSVYSITNPNVMSTAAFFVDVPSDLEIKDFKASVSGDTARFDILLYSPKEKPVSGTFILEDSSGRDAGVLTFTAAVSGETEVARDMKLAERPLAGAYTAKVYIDGTEIVKKYALSIQPVRSIVQAVEERSSGFAKDVKISVTNEGNVVERGYSFQQATPLDTITGMLTRPPENCIDQGGMMVCNYYVNEIRPGSTAYVVYSVSYWPAFNGYLLLTVITAGLVVYSFLRVTSPRILKRHRKKGESVHSISIHVKNPFLYSLKDVTVRDWVSPLVQVLHEEIESTVPVLRRSDEGTELIWKLGEMKPREERILQYKVHSLVKGKLKMPSAQMKFASGKGENKIKLTSNAIVLD